MFKETREMIDSTVYTNGNGEVTAKNINLAFHGVIDATEEKITEVENKVAEIEENETGGSGNALVYFVFDDEGTELTPEQIANNVESYKKIVNEGASSTFVYFDTELNIECRIQPSLVMIDEGMMLFQFSDINLTIPGDSTITNVYHYITIGYFEENGMAYATYAEEVKPASNGPLYIVTDTSTDGSSLTDEQKSDNVRTYNTLMSGEDVPVYMVTKMGGISSIQTMLQTLINREENTVQLAAFIYNGQGGVNPMTVTLYSDGTYSVA